jgi:hypothetical protein
MKMAALALLVVTTSGCATEDPRVVKLATKLASEGGEGISEEQAKRYIPCGVEALSNTPSDQLDAALKASDAPARWAILGSDALDAYVKACRETDKRLRPPSNS